MNRNNRGLKYTEVIINGTKNRCVTQSETMGTNDERELRPNSDRENHGN